MPISAATSAKVQIPANQRGFTLIEMLVAMLLLSLVGLTLARFQTFQLAGTATVSSAVGARLVADNLAVDVLTDPANYTEAASGQVENMGRVWHWQVTPQPAPTDALMQTVSRVDIAVLSSENGQPLVQRSVLRSLPPTVMANASDKPPSQP